MKISIRNSGILLKSAQALLVNSSRNSSTNVQKIKFLKGIGSPIDNVTVIFGCPPIWNTSPEEFRLNTRHITKTYNVKDCAGNTLQEKLGWAIMYYKYRSLGFNVYFCEMNDQIVQNYEQSIQRQYAQKLLEGVIKQDPESRLLFHCIDEHRSILDGTR